jgi:hypothetical protein
MDESLSTVLVLQRDLGFNSGIFGSEIKIPSLPGIKFGTAVCETVTLPMCHIGGL